MNYRNGNKVIPEKNDPLTDKIIGLAIQVHTELGPGFLESVYHQALLCELRSADVSFTSEMPLGVYYKGTSVENFVADIVIEGRLLLELKALEAIQPVHEVQVVNYLKATKLEIGLILNFGRSTLQIRRKYRDYAKPELAIHLQED